MCVYYICRSSLIQRGERENPNDAVVAAVAAVVVAAKVVVDASASACDRIPSSSSSLLAWETRERERDRHLD